MAFRGVEANIELAKFGLVGSRNLAAVPVTALLAARNISLDTGAITRAGGSARYNGRLSDGGYSLEDSSGVYELEDGSGIYLLETGAGALHADIIGLKDWWPTSLLQRLIAYVEHTAGSHMHIYRDATGDGTFVEAYLGTVGGIPVFAEGGSEEIGNDRKLFITNGLDPVQVFVGDAATTRDIGADAPSDWVLGSQPRSLIFHNGRLWGILEHLLYGSTVTDHEDFTNTGSVIIPVQTGEGSFLQGGISFKGRLFLFKWPAGHLKDRKSTRLNSSHV